MPTSTFFRLPEEKRTRLTEAAWEEFSQASVADVSINQIICKARIPRGSFYQYFADKDDLFRHLLTGAQGYFIGIMTGILKESGGDLFAIPVQAFDQFLVQDNGMDVQLNRFVQILRVNQGMDLQRFLLDSRDVIPEAVLGQIDLSRFRRTDPDFLEQTFGLVMLCTATAIIEALTKPEKRDHERKLLCDRVDILAHGSLKPDAVPQQGGDR